MKKLSVLLLLLIQTTLVCPTFAQPSKGFSVDQMYPIEQSHSYIGFSVKYMGYAMVRGRFEQFRGTFRFDEKNIENTSVSFQIETASIDTDLEWRDNDLKSAGWLDTANYPTIQFISKRVAKRKNGFDLIGDLTIKATTKEVTLTMNPSSGKLQDTRGDTQVIFTGTLEIDRTEYGVEGKRWSRVKEGITAVDSKVNIELSILGKQLNVQNLSGWVRNEERPPGKYYKLVRDNGAKSAMGEFEKARAEDNRLNVNALRIVGRLLMKQGQLDEALIVYKQNAASFPESHEALGDLGQVYAVMQNFAEARKAYNNALALNPNDMNASEMLRQLGDN